LTALILISSLSSGITKDGLTADDYQTNALLQLLDYLSGSAVVIFWMSLNIMTLPPHHLLCQIWSP